MSQHDLDGEVVTKKRTSVKKPKMYKVIFHNDEYTTMEFVIEVLETVFHKTPAEAAQLMLSVHNQGSAVVGVYSREVAETKVECAMQWARQEEHPLMVTMEPE